MAIVTAKEKLNGYVLGVRFTDGEADTEAVVALAFFRNSPRFTVHEAPAEDTPAPRRRRRKPAGE